MLSLRVANLKSRNYLGLSSSDFSCLISAGLVLLAGCPESVELLAKQTPLQPDCCAQRGMIIPSAQNTDRSSSSPTWLQARHCSLSWALLVPPRQLILHDYLLLGFSENPQRSQVMPTTQLLWDVPLTSYLSFTIFREYYQIILQFAYSLHLSSNES